MTTKTKTQKLLTALNNGTEVTVAQAISRYGFENASAVSSVVRNLRTEGYSIYTNTNSNGVVRYRIGKPTRAIVAAGYSVLGGSAFA